MIADFSKEFLLLNPYFDIEFNVPESSSGYLYRLIEPACRGQVGSIRSARDDIPQFDGFIQHRRFTEGYVVTLSAAMWQDTDTPACGEVLRIMADRISGALRSILNGQDGRIVFQQGESIITPERLIDQARLVDYQIAKADNALHVVTFTIDSPFPYSMTYTQEQIDIDDGTEVLVNLGNTTTWPVFKIFGPENLFVITNESTGEAIEYDASRPGAQVIPGGSYMEIDTFRQTAYMNGDGANLLPGIDPETSDLFGLIVGENFVNTTAADVEVLYNHAWD